MERVDRRGFLLIAAGLVLAARPVTAARRIARIGFLNPGPRYQGQALLTALRDGLDQLGWVAGRDIVIVDHWAEGHLPELPGLAAELVAARVDLVVTNGTPATLAARAANPSLPIVMVGVEYSAGQLLGAALPPDSNLTGLSLGSTELTGERLRVLQQLVPGLDRIAVMLRDEPGVQIAFEDVRRNARRLGIDVTELVVTSGETIERAFRWTRSNNCRALYFASGPLGSAKHGQVIARAAAARLPTVYPFRAFAEDGGLVSVAPDSQELFRRAAGFVDKVLNGVKPVDLPVAPPKSFELVINLAAAKAIGVIIPEALLARADTVIGRRQES